MGVLWLGARSSTDDAIVERDAAIAERDAANDASIDANAQLQTLQDELDAARAELDDPDGAAVESDDGELQELNDRIEELSAEVERLEAENETLAAGDAESTTTTEPVVLEPDLTTTTAVPATTPATTESAPVSAEDIGDQIAGLFRDDVLGSIQKICLGQAVVDDLGQDRVVEAIAAESPGEDVEFVESLLDAADFCNVDESAIFG